MHVCVRVYTVPVHVLHVTANRRVHLEKYIKKCLFILLYKIFYNIDILINMYMYGTGVHVHVYTCSTHTHVSRISFSYSRARDLLCPLQLPSEQAFANLRFVCKSNDSSCDN